VPSPAHPLAAVAARHCQPQDDHILARRRVRSAACPDCWQRAIVDDQTIAAECGLGPGYVEADPDLIDDIAVERACAGHWPVTLTTREQGVAVRALRAAGLDLGQIADRLRLVTVAADLAPSAVRVERLAVAA
jgi:hypothetical protein